MLDDEIDVINNMINCRNMLYEKLEEIKCKKGILITSPSICCQFQYLPEFVLDIVALDPENLSQTVTKFGTFQNITIYRDYFARTDYIKFEEC